MFQCGMHLGRMGDLNVTIFLTFFLGFFFLWPTYERDISGFMFFVPLEIILVILMLPCIFICFNCINLEKKADNINFN